MIDLKYSEMLSLNNKLKNNLDSSPYSITVLSNIVVHQIREILEYLLRSEGINAIIELGDYDNIVQDSPKYKNSNAIIMFWELSNIISGLQYKIELLNNERLDEILEKTKTEINLVVKNLKNTPLILINKFTSLQFSSSNITANNLDVLADELNQYLEANVPSNARLIDLNRIIASIGISNCLDWRYYYSSKALYTVEFFKAYGEYVRPFILSATGKAKKALIFDCDDTLWKGILGEDGFDNIEMSTTTKDGTIFAEIQSLALTLHKKGVLLGLCSKNNHGDVKEVIVTHPDMQLRDRHFAIKKINWSDKVTNLKAIAQDLKLGLDSLVFVDNSLFEVNLIREKLPEVTVLQVPERLYEYPKTLRKSMTLFYNLSFAEEDSKKGEIYKQQAKRDTSKKEFADVEDYLASLELKLTIFEDNESIIPRIAQMSQKTNQFNLTTKRYTEVDIKKFTDDVYADVYAFSVSDKFGESGITGLSIISLNESVGAAAEIDTLLMSCRIIGRNIEFVFMDCLIRKMKTRNIKVLKAKYIKTPKNIQVENFFDRCAFDLIDEDASVRNYSLTINAYVPFNTNYIEVING